MGLFTKKKVTLPIGWEKMVATGLITRDELEEYSQLFDLGYYGTLSPEEKDRYLYLGSLMDEAINEANWG